MNVHARVVLGTLLLGLSPSSGYADPIGLYEVIPVVGLPGGNATYVNAINNAGQVVGFTYIEVGSVNSAHAFRSDGTTTTAIDPLSGSSAALGINDSGTVVGSSTFSLDPSGSRSAMLFDGSLHDLLAPAGNAMAVAINNAGSAAGNVQNSGFSHAYYYDGAWHDIGTLNSSDNNVVANDINNSGQIVGSSSTYTSGNATGQAILYDGTMHGLGTLAGFNQGEATAINDFGQVVGFAFNPSSGPSDTYRAFRYDGVLHDLGVPGLQSIAEDINNLGFIVGQSYSGSEWNAFIYSDGSVFDLNDHLAVSGSGWTIQFATGINDAGQIAVYGRSASSGLTGAILNPCSTCSARPPGTVPIPSLNPVPEPGSLVLIGTGIAWLGRRHARRGLRH